MQKVNYICNLFKVTSIIRKCTKELNLNQFPRLTVVSDGEIQNFIGSAEYNISNNKPSYILKLVQNLITTENIKDTNSQLYITLYHELCHLKNIEILNQNISNLKIVNTINGYDSMTDMLYDFAFMLWGEYYAYSKQFIKFNQTPVTANTFIATQTLYSDIMRFGKERQVLCGKQAGIILHDVYGFLYDIIVNLSYQNAYKDYDLTSMIDVVEKYLHVNIDDFITQFKVFLDILWSLDDNQFTIEHFKEFGNIIFQIYHTLNIEISFCPKLCVSLLTNQPINSIGEEE